MHQLQQIPGEEGSEHKEYCAAKDLCRDQGSVEAAAELAAHRAVVTLLQIAVAISANQIQGGQDAEQHGRADGERNGDEQHRSIQLDL